ncbi:MAG: hypothetical protein LUG95_08350 [Clostridiales bacterium]|nr:hypothetical protein [Clostridiales bacterium]
MDIDSSVLSDAFAYDTRVDAQNIALKSLYNVRLTPVGNSISASYICENALEDYNSQQSKKDRLSDTEIEEISSLVNTAFDDVYMIENSQEYSTLNLLLSYDIKMIFVSLAASVILAVMIYFLCSGRRKSFNFAAMSFVTAGDITLALSLYIMFKADFGGTMFTNISAYNLALSNALDSTYKILLAAGAVLIVIGVAIFISTYKYYTKKIKKYES